MVSTMLYVYGTNNIEYRQNERCSKVSSMFRKAKAMKKAVRREHNKAKQEPSWGVTSREKY